MIKNTFIATLAALTLSACTSTEEQNAAADNTSRYQSLYEGVILEYNACESTYYSGLRGNYTGTYEIKKTDTNNNTTMWCEFDMSIDILGEPRVVVSEDPDAPFSSDGCYLTGTYKGTVAQPEFLPAGDPNAYQCITPEGTFELDDPFNKVINADIFYQNVNYPVTIKTAGNNTFESTGPYLNNNDVQANYAHFMQSSDRTVVDKFVISENGGLQIQPVSTDSPNVFFRSLISKQQTSNSGL